LLCCIDLDLFPIAPDRLQLKIVNLTSDDLLKDCSCPQFVVPQIGKPDHLAEAVKKGTDIIWAASVLDLDSRNGGGTLGQLSPTMLNSCPNLKFNQIAITRSDSQMDRPISVPIAVAIVSGPSDIELGTFQGDMFDVNQGRYDHSTSRNVLQI